MMMMVFSMGFMLIMVMLTSMSFWGFVMMFSLYFFIFMYYSPMFLGGMFMGYEFVIDTLGFSMVVLSVWLMLLMALSSFKINKEKANEALFIFLLMFLELMLILTFSISNYIGLYIFFEAALIPTLLVIVGWGYQTERLQAGVYFLFYTVVSSLPLLVMFLYFYSENGSVSLLYFLMEENSKGGLLGMLGALSLTSAFLVKIPLFFVHLWLPSAHVEAPVAGSMILAGVLLKLGGYGLCRVMMGFPSVMLSLSELFVSLSLFSMVVVGYMCCRMNDMKALVAYSSVAHMGLVVAGLFIGGVVGFTGALVMMVGHGVASSGLFMILNVYYERTGSRSFYVNSGMILTLPALSLFMFVLCASNMGAPPTINLLSELYLLGSLMGFSWVMILVLPLGSFMGVVFTIFLFSHSQHGKVGFSLAGYWNLLVVEFSSLMLHSIPLNLMVLKFDLFLLWL